mmetsp:Transcript_10958/g.28466  ORF Transcript_10958/g.28466 Transcript_10958/m.28466 type:complete len:236 (-) Transcript_10958:509-1216(-)
MSGFFFFAGPQQPPPLGSSSSLTMGAGFAGSDGLPPLGAPPLPFGLASSSPAGAISAFSMVDLSREERERPSMFLSIDFDLEAPPAPASHVVESAPPGALSAARSSSTFFFASCSSLRLAMRSCRSFCMCTNSFRSIEPECVRSAVVNMARTLNRATGSARPVFDACSCTACAKSSNEMRPTRSRSYFSNAAAARFICDGRSWPSASMMYVDVTIDNESERYEPLPYRASWICCL